MDGVQRPQERILERRRARQHDVVDAAGAIVTGSVTESWLGVPIIAGRDFTEADSEGAPLADFLALAEVDPDLPVHGWERGVGHVDDGDVGRARPEERSFDRRLGRRDRAARSAARCCRGCSG